jgi:hypothetical protein
MPKESFLASSGVTTSIFLPQQLSSPWPPFITVTMQPQSWHLWTSAFSVMMNLLGQVRLTRGQITYTHPGLVTGASTAGYNEKLGQWSVSAMREAIDVGAGRLVGGIHSG